MTFEEILDQAIAMLQRRGRVSYRALQRQFQLDDAYLQDLTTEIVEVLQLAVDQNHTMLVWTGGPSASAPVSPLTLSMVPLDPQEPHPTPRIPAPSVQPAPDAERRQLTVMFCDLVDSTRLSSQLDPEVYRDVVRAYQTACTEVIQRYDGHIAQLLGDGLLVYFGYPQAHEDDAHRAVRAALGILAAMDDLHMRLPHATGRTLAVRLGIHTGLVVIGTLGEAGRQEQLALGETPNIAARIEGLAQPNTVAISEATWRLVQGYFACEALGAQTLRGVAEPVTVYQVFGESGATSRLDVAQPRGLTPLVGRESEVTLLQERWEQAKSGQGQVVLLTGDAGIGKSRLVQMLKDHVANEPYVRWECRSAEYYQNTALFPLVELFQRLSRFEAHETPDAKLTKLEQTLSQYRLPLEETVPLFAPLLSLPITEDHYPPLALSPQRQRQKTLETIVAILQEHAERHPVLFIVEDLHWTDPSTLELLNLGIEQIPTTSILTVLTCRPHFQPAWHHRSYLTEITVNRLSHAQVEQFVNRMTDGKALPTAVLQRLIAKTDGVPLFVEELTKAILESGSLKEVDDHYELTGSLSTFTIPTTLQDSLMARLDRLVTAKAVAQYAAVIGRQFSYELLSTVSQLDAATLQRELGRLVEAEIVYQRSVPPQATYTFKHALIQDTAYQSLLKSTRQLYHQQIARVLEEGFPEIKETEPELLAHHYTEAGLHEQALGYWQRAGQRALKRSATVEAIGHLMKALEVLKTFPETPERARHELALQLALGPALMAAKGQAATEVRQVYARAHALCQQVGDTPQLFPALRGLWNFYLVRAELQTAHGLAEQLLTLAQRADAPALLPGAHRALGVTLFYLGEAAAAQVHLERGISLYDPQRHRAQAFLYGEDTGVGCRAYAAQTLWLLGYPDQALQRSGEAVVLARELLHPPSLAFALNFATRIHQFRRERPSIQERAAELTALSREHRFMQRLATGMIQQGWALAATEQGAERIVQMYQGLAAYRATGGEVGQPYFLALLAEVYGNAGQAEEGLRVLGEALAAGDSTEERWWEAELHRLKGELLLQQSSDNQVAAESCFHHALEIARTQQAKSFELRAATSLARLWQQQGKRQEAYDLLAPVYHWFTEGFDTADLKDAKALLEALA